MVCIALAFATEWKFNEINLGDVCVRVAMLIEMISLLFSSFTVNCTRYSDDTFSRFVNISNDKVSYQLRGCNAAIM